jgi:hypothetical protein
MSKKNPEYYRSKCQERLCGFLQSRGFSINTTRTGTLNDCPTICVILDPETDREKLKTAVVEVRKCFRKAVVHVGKDANKPYAPEIKYPTIYLAFNPDNPD